MDAQHRREKLIVIALVLTVATAILISRPPAMARQQGTANLNPMATTAEAARCPRSGGELVTQPVVDPEQFCPEYLVKEMPDSAIAAITSLAFASPCTASETDPVWCGRLFFAQPASGSISWLGDYDEADQQFEIHNFVTDLDIPVGLAWHDQALYVSARNKIYRVIDPDGDGSTDDVSIIVDALPQGPGYWSGSTGIGPDGRIYISTGAPCPQCIFDDQRRGAILSYDLNGSDEQLVATGFQFPFDFAWQPATQALFASDAGRDDLGPDLPLDEINVVRPGEYYGWPSCIATSAGVEETRLQAPSSARPCQDTVPPFATFPTHSSPAGLAFYQGTAFPEYADDLLVVLHGESDGRLPHGHALYRLCLNSLGEPETCKTRSGEEVLGPDGNPATMELLVPRDMQWNNPLDLMHIQQQSFYPEHPVDVAVSPEGNIVVSIMEGRIIQLSPATP